MGEPPGSAGHDTVHVNGMLGQCKLNLWLFWTDEDDLSGFGRNSNIFHTPLLQALLGDKALVTEPENTFGTIFAIESPLQVFEEHVKPVDYWLLDGNPLPSTKLPVRKPGCCTRREKPCRSRPPPDIRYRDRGDINGAILKLLSQLLPFIEHLI